MANKSNKVEKELLRVIKESSKIKLPEEFSDMILMPFEISLMRGDFTKIQYDVILSLLSNLRDKFRDVIETKKKIDELQQLGKDGLNEQQEKPSDTVTQIFFDESKKEDFKKLTIPQQKRSIVREYVQLELFADEEQTLAEEFKIQEDSLVRKFYLKEFGVSDEHYSALISALKTMASLPVQIPYISPTGKEYDKVRSFCTAYFPKAQPKKNHYVVIEIERKVAEKLCKMDFGYHIINKAAAKELGVQSKYTEKLYFFLNGEKKNGFKEMTIEELREELSVKHKYNSWGALKQILEPSIENINLSCTAGKIDFWVKYEPIYLGTKKCGWPSRVKFYIKNRGEEDNDLDQQLELKSRAEYAEFREILQNDLKLPPQVVLRMSSRLTNENCSDAVNKAISIMAQVDNNEKVKKPVSYVIKSLNDFFKNYQPKMKPGNDSSNSEPKKGFSEWTAMMSEFCKGLDAKSVSETISRMSFGGFDPTTTPKKTLTINVPSQDIQHRIENDYREMFLRMLKKHFGEGISIKFYIPEEKEVDDDTEQK